ADRTAGAGAWHRRRRDLPAVAGDAVSTFDAVSMAILGTYLTVLAGIAIGRYLNGALGTNDRAENIRFAVVLLLVLVSFVALVVFVVQLVWIQQGMPGGGFYA